MEAEAAELERACNPAWLSYGDYSAALRELGIETQPVPQRNKMTPSGDDPMLHWLAWSRTISPGCPPKVTAMHWMTAWPGDWRWFPARRRALALSAVAVVTWRSPSMGNVSSRDLRLPARTFAVTYLAAVNWWWTTRQGNTTVPRYRDGPHRRKHADLQPQPVRRTKFN